MNSFSQAIASGPAELRVSRPSAELVDWTDLRNVVHGSLQPTGTGSALYRESGSIWDANPYEIASDARFILS